MMLLILNILEKIVNNLKSPQVTTFPKEKNINNQTRLLQPIKVGFNEK